MLLCVALSIYIYSIGRVTLRDSRTFPAVAMSATVDDADKIWVELGEGFAVNHVRHLNDGTCFLDVINLAGLEVAADFVNHQRLLRRLQNGERLSLALKGRKVTGLKVEWMPAALRITLDIPLHPDRMGTDDWDVLPGIGVKLAMRIESDRHINGEFGSLEALKRVNGIGDGRIANWRKFF